MARKRRESYKDIILLQDKMEQYFDAESSSVPSITRTWNPVIDLFETDDCIHLHVELPGVEEKDIKIEVHDNIITIQGQRAFKPAVKEEGYICVERSYGPFQRTFRLPAPIIEKEVKAEFKMGVLKITMPKDKRPGPKSVRVEIA